MKGTEIKAAKVIEFILESELSEYSFKYEVTESEMGNINCYGRPDYYVKVEINGCEHQFKVDFKNEVVGDIDEDNFEDDCNVEVLIDFDADIWETIKTYSWEIKYFWMAILNWD